jgi:(1->4)-alpha-D-glucan 1-alpha-D-glucosylmutase
MPGRRLSRKDDAVSLALRMRDLAVMQHPTPPASTYRVQLSSSYTLNDLANQVPYLAELGVTDIYLSPIYTARPGSTHGYDIVDHTKVDPQLGGCEDWRRLCSALHSCAVRVILDVVPNHMAADPVHNLLWRQLLRDGPSSPTARYFDVDWQPLTGLIRDKVILPVLEEPYGAALLQRKVALERSGSQLLVRYGAVHFPLAPSSLDLILPGSPVSSNVDLEQDLEHAVDDINSDPRRLHDVLEAQHYRLAYWRSASDEINYRRFFDVNELIAIRAEDDEIFDRSHRLILELSQEGVVHGLRVDHVDGLMDPLQYLQRLRQAADDASKEPMWIVVEKILDRLEPLDAEWPVNGTTGYDALNVLNRLFVSGRGVRTLRRFYQMLVDDRSTFREVAYRSKRLVMEGTLRSGLTILAHALKRVADASWETRDLSLNALSAALVEFIASLPVYRTYLGNGVEREFDRTAVEHGVAWAVRRNPSMDSSALTFLRSLLLESTADEPTLQEAKRQVVRRLQQYTSSVHAKGVEDTAYYRDNTLISLNEVGGNPGGPSCNLAEFHRFNEQRLRIWPDTLNTTSTHDTKLGEDTRLRISALSVYTQEWISAVRSWRAMNAPHRRETDNRPSPSLNDEYRFYQVLLGIWPTDDCVGEGPASPALVERVQAYIQKAVREAGVDSSWVRPDGAYEAAVDCFVRRLLEDESAAKFRSSLRELVRLVLPLSVCHSIGQLVLKCLMPGLPDVYQGGESWLLTVTDPDNRQPVDFVGHADALRRLRVKTPSTSSGSISPDEVLSSDFKLDVTAKLLRFRRDHRSMMSRGDYGRLRARGPCASSIVAFERSERQGHLVVAVPRLVEQHAGRSGWPAGPAFWEDTVVRLPSSVASWTHILSGEVVTGHMAWAPLSKIADSWPWVVLYGRE